MWLFSEEMKIVTEAPLNYPAVDNTSDGAKKERLWICLALAHKHLDKLNRNLSDFQVTFARSRF